MKAKDYFERVVTPLVEEFIADTSSRHRMYAAVVILYHIVDHIAEGDQKLAAEVRETIIQDCPGFGYIYRIALAQKHAVVHNEVQRGLRGVDILDETTVSHCWRAPNLPAQRKLLGVERPPLLRIEKRHVNIPSVVLKCHQYLDGSLVDLIAKFRKRANTEVTR